MNVNSSCACQGIRDECAGASYSFGCSWSMYYNLCKYAKSHKENIRKFKLTNQEQEPAMEAKLQDLATHIGPLYR